MIIDRMKGYMDLNSTKIFVYVISKGNFTKAARYLGIPIATVSRKVRELEEQVGLALIERSTRKLRLTEPGAVLYEYASRGLEEMEAGLLALTHQQNKLIGTLRISIPPNFKTIWCLISDFQEAYEKINIEVMVTERKIDFIEDAIDLSLRIGTVDSLSVIAKCLHTYRHRLVAARNYFEHHPKIKKPNDLLQHKCAMWGSRSSKKAWYFENQVLTLEPRLLVNDYAFVHYLLETGKYIVEVPPFLCEKEIKQGIYIEIVKDFKFPEQEINLVYPSSRQVSRITRVFIDYCIQNFSNCLTHVATPNG